MFWMQEIQELFQQSNQLYQQGRYREALEPASKVYKLCCQHLGENHPENAVVISNMGGIYHKLGDYNKAEWHYKQALKIMGEGHPKAAIIKNNLVALYQTTGRYEAAKLYQQEAVQGFKANFEEDSLTVAANLSNQALIDAQKGDYEKAEALYQKALDIVGKNLGVNNSDFLNILGNLARLYQDMGNYTASEQKYLQVLEAQRITLGDNHPDYATTLGHLGQLYEILGKYNAAESPYKKAIDIYRKKLGDNHPLVAVAKNLLAGLYYRIGNYKAAEILFHQVINSHRKNFDKNHPYLAISLNNLANLYQQIGNYAAAARIYQELQEINEEQGNDYLDLTKSSVNQAALYVAMGSYQSAEKILGKSQDILKDKLGETHPEYAALLNSIAVIYLKMLRYAAAEPILHQVTNILRRKLGENHPDFVMTLNNLARLYEIKGLYYSSQKLFPQANENYATAEQIELRIVQINRMNWGENHPNVALSLNNIATLYQITGNYATAESPCRQALNIWRKTVGEDSPKVVAALINLSTLYGARGREEEAIALLKEAAAIDDRTIGQIFSIGSESQRMAYLQQVRLQFLGFLSMAFQDFRDDRSTIQTAFDLILRRKGIGAEAVAVQRDALLGGRYPQLKSKLQQLTSLRMQIAEKTLAGPGSEELPAHQQTLTEWNDRKERLETALVQDIPEMNIERQLLAADRRAVALALPENTVLVEFIRFSVFDFKAVIARGESQFQAERYIAIVLPAGEPENIRAIELGEAESIDQKIAKFRATITGETALRNFDTIPMHQIPGAIAPGIELRKAIFDPLAEAIGTCQRLFLAPDGDLAKLPFEVLPLDDGSRLIDKYRISYLSTGRDVLRFGTGPTHEPSASLVVADPDFDLNSAATKESEKSYPALSALGKQSRDLDRSSQRFKRLQGTREEGEQIAAQLGVKPWMKAEVLESKLKEVRSPRILHLATHGFFLENQKQEPNQERLGLAAIGDTNRLSAARLENPLLRSGLALAGANTWLKRESLPPEAEDGILTAEDVSGLDLLDTELVVLSACDTGLGEVQTGEGVFGLRRAFVLAGAKTLVMSLWKVPDKQTQELMTDYYRRILAGEPRGEALRSAQLEMKKKYPNPYYWGAFICQGDPSYLP